jgi:cytochrome b pre-mRNA-processing protein 3
MSLFDRLLGRKAAETDTAPLWQRVIEIAREPQWYSKGGVADTVPGRFDCISMVLALVLIRMEREAELRPLTGRLTEHFVDDMDGQLRQNGIGDLVVGKHVGKLVSALGGRIDAYRAALADADDAALIEAVSRNMSLNEGADSAAIAAEIRVIAGTLDRASAAELIAGRVAR